MATLELRAAPGRSSVRAGEPFRLSYWQHGAIFLFACLIVFWRRPDMLLHAQFYAEDGACWYADAYNLGYLRALLLPWHGFFQTVPRLAAGPALLVPLSLAPGVLNLFQIGFQALPVNILLGGRSAPWGGLRFRAAMAVLYLALPDCSEISYGVGWSIWPMALVGALLIVGALPEGWGQRMVEAVFLLLMGLSGPMCIVLLPIMAYLAWKRPARWRWVQCTILAACAAVQLYTVLILDRHGRPYYGLRIPPGDFVRILSGNVFLGTLLGRNLSPHISGGGGLLFLCVVAVGGLVLLGWCFLHSRVEMRLFLVFASMLLASALARPTEYPPPGMTNWEYFVQLPDIRYWFVPSVAFAWAILWCRQNGNRAFKGVSTLLLGVMAFASIWNWEHPTLPDLHFPEYVARFEAAPPGTVVKGPQNPVNSGWEIKLVKH